MPASKRILERPHAAALLVNSALGIECLVIHPQSQITIEVPPDHLGGCFCQRLEGLTGETYNLGAMFSRVEKIASSSEGESFYIYNCPFGLANIIVPVFESGSFAAALQIGPIMTASPDELLARHGALSHGAGNASLQEIRDYLNGLPAGGISFVLSVAKMASAIVSGKDVVVGSPTLEADIAGQQAHTKKKADIGCAIRDFVLENFTDNAISLDMVARNVYVHPSYVSRIFAKQFNSNFRAYINELRVGLAEDMLASTDKSIGDICHEVGFSDHSYFNKVFKQHCGLTPSQFREQAKSHGEGEPAHDGRATAEPDNGSTTRP